MNILYYVYLGIRYNLNIVVEKTTFELCWGKELSLEI